MKLDVGGIAKGYASQAAIDVLNRGDRPRPGRRGRRHRRRRPAARMPRAGRSPSRRGFAGSPYRPPTLLLKNAAVSTAGDAERFVEIDGHRYSHIVNPRHRHGPRGPRGGHRGRPRWRHRRRAGDGRLSPRPRARVEAGGRDPRRRGTSSDVTPEGVKTSKSSRFRQVPKVEDRRCGEQRARCQPALMTGIADPPHSPVVPARERRTAHLRHTMPAPYPRPVRCAREGRCLPGALIAPDKSDCGCLACITAWKTAGPLIFSPARFLLLTGWSNIAEPCTRFRRPPLFFRTICRPTLELKFFQEFRNRTSVCIAGGSFWVGYGDGGDLDGKGASPRPDCRTSITTG